MLTELRTRLTAASGVGGSPAGVADINAARAVLHKLKGSALTLGAAAVGACCDAVRQHCLAGDMAALHAPGGSLAMLEVATQQVLGALVDVCMQRCQRRCVSETSRYCRHVEPLHSTADGHRQRRRMIRSSSLHIFPDQSYLPRPQDTIHEAQRMTRNQRFIAFLSRLSRTDGWS